MESDRNRMITTYVSFVLAARIKVAKWPESRDELERDYFKYVKPIKDSYEITREEFLAKKEELEQEPLVPIIKQFEKQ